MTQKPASCVLALLKASPYKPSTHRPFARCGLACGAARLGAPGWAGETAGFFVILCDIDVLIDRFTVR
jgi:hypothetical protein